MRLILIISCISFVTAYLTYGRYLAKKYCIDNKRDTPSHSMYDGIDYVPAHRAVLLGHHFSSIAGAGPIVGPIIAAIAFGWIPALLWVLIGCIFIGAVHDFSALVASIRHHARSIADIAKEYLSPKAQRLFLIFVWLALIYIVVVFVDLTSATFVQDGGVATSSLLYIILAVLFGISLYRFKLRLSAASVLFIPLVFVVIFGGQSFPMDLSSFSYLPFAEGKLWSILLLAYCAVASILPVWLLLQPRDYLSSFLLYACVLFGIIGILFGDTQINYPYYLRFNAPALGLMFPVLFITVACGAISGFHSLVASGTSSKQLNKESDSLVIGYGGMLLEGVVAVIAITAVAILGTQSEILKQQPLMIFASAMGKFFSTLNLDPQHGVHFGLLALSAFILTTLDTATRIGRYVFQEFFSLKGAGGRIMGTIATITIPFVMIFMEFKDPQGNIVPAWKIIWPLFGSTNQLLGALALLVIYVWLRKKYSGSLFILVPMLFMLIVTLSSLFLLILKYNISLIGIIAILLFCLALFLIYETARIIFRWNKQEKKKEMFQ